MQRTLIKDTLNKIGETVTLFGFAETKRDHGKVTFIDLRDRTGKIQIVGYKMLSEVKTESVLEVVGEVKARPEKQINPELITGTVELDVKEYKILGSAQDLPILVEGDGLEMNEEVRLKYRYLDLRRARLTKNIRLRSNFVRALRDALYEQDFVEIETPILSQTTKEGARDFLVPSRLQPGTFYALPQSPQQYKQLLMASGFERYFQVARCFRDEDLRADRLLELTQLDLEMSYVFEPQEVMQTVEAIVKKAVQAVGGKLQKADFPVINYQEAMEKYGADRFDLRTEQEKKDGVLAFAWVVNFPFFKKVDRSDAAEVLDGKSGWTFTHNPFSAALPEDQADWLAGKNIAGLRAAQYDLVCNGYEVGGGSIRAHTREALMATYKIMGYTEAEVEASVGHLLRAFDLGTPPHGGLALGLDRLLMVLTGEESIKEVVAFPTTGSGKTAVMDGPSAVADEQLAELGLTRKAL
ncbi:MAG: amino acid--tRNA ligase-related protein [bacterium]|nr:amino acid--tRNA ligase-related protein [bacterium]